MTDLILRFLIGGSVVSLFAILGDVLRPKSFAGLFGAAPSIALATLGMTIHRNGKDFAAVETRSMVFGALGFLVYSVAVSWVLRRYKPSTLLVTITLMPSWFIVAFGVWFLAERLA
jgi:uncharacterized membrane protein (GlpM family)